MDAISITSNTPLPIHQVEAPAKSVEEESEMEKSNEKEILGKRKGEEVQYTSDHGSAPQWKKVETKRRTKNTAKSLSPEALTTERNLIQADHEYLKINNGGLKLHVSPKPRRLLAHSKYHQGNEQNTCKNGQPKQIATRAAKTCLEVKNELGCMYVLTA